MRMNSGKLHFLILGLTFGNEQTKYLNSFNQERLRYLFITKLLVKVCETKIEDYFTI